MSADEVILWRCGVEIITKRLILRPIITDDVYDVFEYSKEPNVGPNAGWKPHESIEESLQVMQDIFINKENVFGIVLKKTGKLIGSVGLIDDKKRENDAVKMLGYAIGEKYWGQGYMTEAGKAVVLHGFKIINLALISAYCYSSNTRSQGVLNKLGFQYEGKLALCEKIYDGSVYDNECFALWPEELNSLYLE